MKKPTKKTEKLHLKLVPMTDELALQEMNRTELREFVITQGKATINAILVYPVTGSLFSLSGHKSIRSQGLYSSLSGHRVFIQSIRSQGLYSAIGRSIRSQGLYSGLSGHRVFTLPSEERQKLNFN